MWSLKKMIGSAWATGRFDIKALWAEKRNEHGDEKGCEIENEKEEEKGYEKDNHKKYEKGDQKRHERQLPI